MMKDKGQNRKKYQDSRDWLIPGNQKIESLWTDTIYAKKAEQVRQYFEAPVVEYGKGEAVGSLSEISPVITSSGGVSAGIVSMKQRDWLPGDEDMQS